MAVELGAHFHKEDVHAQTTKYDVDKAIGVERCPVHQGTWISKPKYVMCFTCGRETRDCPKCHPDTIAQQQSPRESQREVTSMELSPRGSRNGCGGSVASLIGGGDESPPPPPPLSTQFTKPPPIIPQRSQPKIRPQPPLQRSVSFIPDDWVRACSALFRRFRVTHRACSPSSAYQLLLGHISRIESINRSINRPTKQERPGGPKAREPEAEAQRR